MRITSEKWSRVPQNCVFEIDDCEQRWTFKQKFDVIHCAAILNEIAPLFESNALKPPVIGQRYTLSDVVQAYGSVVAGKGGKTVFVMA